MLTPSYLLHATEPAEEIAEKLHQDILRRIIERIRIRFERGDEYVLTAIDKWQIETLQQAGFLLDEIQKEIASATDLMITEIAEAMEDAGVTALEYDDKIYREAGLDPAPLTQSPHLIQVMQRDYEATFGEWENFTRTTATSSQQTFIRLCDTAYHQAITGMISPQQAVKEALEELIRDGIYVTYPSGHRETIESATARCVRTGISQASAHIQTARMDEFGVDLVIVSSHLGARPSHQVWQGKVYSRSGSGEYPDFVSSTGYGSVSGLCGANCRHHFSPWFEGQGNPFEQFDAEENMKQYELEQRQRTLERRIRHTKQQVLGYDAAGDKENYERKSALLQKQNEAYNQFCKDNGLKKQQDRISIARWNRSEAAKARAAAKKHQKELEKQENLDKMVSELRERKLIPTRSRVHIPPDPVFLKKLSFDDQHINKERKHNVTREMAEVYIQQSKISLTVWNGQFERYYGTNGAVYIDWLNNSIRTAFSGEEFNEQTIQLLEVLEKYGY